MNLGIIELTEIAAREKRKTILKVISLNDPKNVPTGFTAVYLREIFVQVLPDEVMGDIKELFINGFQWNMEERWIRGLTTNSTDYYELSTKILICWLDWAEKHLRNDG